jgi:RHS repeat-associated protein
MNRRGSWNRYYDPGIGRYVQPEPELETPTHSGEAARSTPAYAYVFNNPVHYVDPNGRSGVIPMDSPDDWIMLPLTAIAIGLCYATGALDRPKPKRDCVLIAVTGPGTGKPMGGNVTCTYLCGDKQIKQDRYSKKGDFGNICSNPLLQY